jgi:hypothetical protein
VKSQLDIVRDVSSRLAKLEVPCMLTGSVAASYYAEPRMTRDIDLVLDLRPQGVDALGGGGLLRDLMNELGHE